MSFTKKINLAKIINELNSLIKKIQLCPKQIYKNVINKINYYKNIITKPSNQIKLKSLFELIDYLQNEIKKCKTVTTVTTNTVNIMEKGWKPPSEYNEINERHYVQNINSAYKKLNKVNRGEENILLDTELITLLNFINYYSDPYWKTSLNKLISTYKISGIDHFNRRKNLAIRMSNLIFGKALKITSGENKGKFKETNNIYYFSYKRRQRSFFKILEKQLEIADDMGFSNEIDILLARIKNIKYFLKYLSYKNKYLKLKNLI